MGALPLPDLGEAAHESSRNRHMHFAGSGMTSSASGLLMAIKILSMTQLQFTNLASNTKNPLTLSATARLDKTNSSRKALHSTDHITLSRYVTVATYMLSYTFTAALTVAQFTHLACFAKGGLLCI